MSILAKLFGDCLTVRFEGVTENGEMFSGTVKIESFNHDKAELEQILKDQFYVQTGRKAEILKIIASM